MRLYHTASSPFVRKVLVAAHELGLAGRIETVFLRPSPTKADGDLAKSNPLSKIPALIDERGEALYDSPVICEYLDSLAPRRLVPDHGPSRFRVLRQQALCDGILDAGILVRYEHVERPEALRWDGWIKGQTEKAKLGLDALELEVANFSTTEIDLGQICAAVTFGWFEFRKPIGDIRKGRPQLTAFFERFSERPSMKATFPAA
ncbi:MAG: glutathione S-transferase [Myxococcales bacterium]|nr:glutathione S-transferase [Myxococcales bacterium]